MTREELLNGLDTVRYEYANGVYCNGYVQPGTCPFQDYQKCRRDGCAIVEEAIRVLEAGAEQ